MRLRNNPNALVTINESDYVIKEFNKSYFNNSNEVHLEIGCGKGDFIIGMARKYPHINFIAIEKFPTVLEKAIIKANDAKLDNVLFTNVDANNLLEVFNEKSISCIYLNFSDPWPKKKHYKRRLTYKSFLEIYEKLLLDNGSIKQKTDNKSLFESSLISFNEYNTHFDFVSVDLHNSEANEDNVQSEYERKFSQNNQPIYAINIRFKKEK